MSVEITADQQKLFQLLLQASQPLTIQQLCEQSGIEQPMVMGTMTFAEEQGWVSIEKIVRKELIPSEDAREIVDHGFPERRFLAILREKETMEMREVAELAKEKGIKVNDILKWGVMRGWVEKQQRNLAITATARENPPEQSDEKALMLAIERGAIFLDDLPAEIDSGETEKFLGKRSDLAKIKERAIRFARVTDKGKEVFPQLRVKSAEQSQLSPEDIASGKWREIKLRPYDVTLQAEVRTPVKCHPLQKIIQETRRTFLEMGFSEMASPHLDLGFWDFDALFQPQDHPSRDMQDTFYMKRPLQGQLPEGEVVERVQKTHEDGGDTGSEGWGYSWDADEARRMVLRTHTTATSVRYIASNPRPPAKVFCVGRVFRNETISFKHLPEFHQVDGIIIDKNASFAALLGTLRKFYEKMGFSRVKFKPAFFPYTEPSAEVFVWMEQKNCWIELGGSGVFRPEVTRPLGCRVPVLAWGLGLERLAMLRYGSTDIRVLYGSDLDWLQEVRLCQ